MNNQPHSRHSQHGAVLILVAFIIGLGAAALVFKMFNASSLQAEQDKKTMQALNETKQALIAWAVSHPNHPGILPFPDRNDDAPRFYDDKSDCVTVGVVGSHLIGRLPLLSDVNCVNPQQGLGVAGVDATGERLWYSVSINLVRMSDASPTPVINPSIVNSPAQPWFVVRDRGGAIISDRVAAVIIAPGAPLPNQDRSSGIANPNQYLDKIVMADNTPYQNYGYQDPATNPVQEFIIGDDFRRVAKNDPTYKNQSVEPYYYNDKLVYITIDELIAAIEKRAAAELRTQLLNYKQATDDLTPLIPNDGYFPYAAKLGASKAYACVTNQVAGVLPISNPAPASATCNYNRAGTNVTADCGVAGFNQVAAVFFSKTNPLSNFTASAGACTFSGRDCTCTGAGSCTRGAQTFRCDAAANCDTDNTAVGEIRFMGGEFDPATKSGRCAATVTASDTCQQASPGVDIRVNVRCAGVGVGSVSRNNACPDLVFNSGASALSAWLMGNRWYDYFYYISSRDGQKLTAGKPNLDALLVGTGWSVVAPGVSVKGENQIKPSCDIGDYLDSGENTNLDPVYDAIAKQRTQNYNDHTYIVAP